MISVSDKEWRERKLDNNLINKCSQDNNFPKYYQNWLYQEI